MNHHWFGGVTMQIPSETFRMACRLLRQLTAQGDRYSSFSGVGNKAKELNYTDPASLIPPLCSSALV